MVDIPNGGGRGRGGGGRGSRRGGAGGLLPLGGRARTRLLSSAPIPSLSSQDLAAVTAPSKYLPPPSRVCLLPRLVVPEPEAAVQGAGQKLPPAAPEDFDSRHTACVAGQHLTGGGQGAGGSSGKQAAAVAVSGVGPLIGQTSDWHMLVWPAEPSQHKGDERVQRTTRCLPCHLTAMYIFHPLESVNTVPWVHTFPYPRVWPPQGQAAPP